MCLSCWIISLRRNGLPQLVSVVVDCDSGFVSQLLGELVAFQNLHSDPLVLVDKIFELVLHIFLFHLKNTLCVLQLFQSFQQFLLLLLNLFLLGKSLIILILAYLAFFFELQLMIL